MSRKNHKWKFNTTIDCYVCERCNIARMKDQWNGGIVYIDLEKDPYSDRFSKKRPDCKLTQEE